MRAFAKNTGLFEEGWKPLWIIDFPMFEYDDNEKKWTAVHHPFTSPKFDNEDNLFSDPSKVKANAYDMVINGWEVGGGSVRIHKAEIQKQVFKILNISKIDAKSKFGFLFNSPTIHAKACGCSSSSWSKNATNSPSASSIAELVAAAIWPFSFRNFIFIFFETLSPLR